MSSVTNANHGLSSTDFCSRELDNQWADVDHPLFYFDPNFKQFCAQKLQELEQLEAGWDYSDAPPISREVIVAVRDFVNSLPQHVATRPMVVPLSSGNVQLEWHHGRTSLELEFESPVLVHFLKWNPEKQIEEEDVLAASDHEALTRLIRWFMKEMLDA
jgi:hypothetical protein